jgi:hypothetical protein
MRHSALSALFAAAVFAALAGACTSTTGENGQYCLKNDDCESKHCASNVCGPEEAFGPPSSTGGASGSGAAGGASGAGDVSVGGGAGVAGSSSPH